MPVACPVVYVLRIQVAPLARKGVAAVDEMRN